MDNMNNINNNDKEKQRTQKEFIDQVVLNRIDMDYSTFNSMHVTSDMALIAAANVIGDDSPKSRIMIEAMPTSLRMAAILMKAIDVELEQVVIMVCAKHLVAACRRLNDNELINAHGALEYANSHME